MSVFLWRYRYAQNFVWVYVCADKYCSYSKLSVILHTHAHTHHVLGDFDTGWVSMRRSTQNYYLIGQQLLVFTQKLFHNHAFGSLQLIYHHYFSSPSQFLVKSFSHYLTICLIFMFLAMRTLHIFLTPCKTAHTTFYRIIKKLDDIIMEKIYERLSVKVYHKWSSK